MTDAALRTFPYRRELRFNEVAGSAFARRCAERVIGAFALPDQMPDSPMIESQIKRLEEDPRRRAIAIVEGLNALELCLRSSATSVDLRLAIRASQSALLCADAADRLDSPTALLHAFCAVRYAAGQGQNKTLPATTHCLLWAVSADLAQARRGQDLHALPLWHPSSATYDAVWSEEAARSAGIVRTMRWPPNAVGILPAETSSFAATCRRFLESQGCQVLSIKPRTEDSLIADLRGNTRKGDPFVALSKPNLGAGFPKEAMVLLAASSMQVSGAKEAMVFVGETVTQEWRGTFLAGIGVRLFDSADLEASVLRLMPMETIETISRKERGPVVTLDRIDVANYRGIKSVSLNLQESPARVTFLVGANASGKSSALDASAAVLSRVSNAFRSALPSRHLLPRDVRKGSTDCRLVARLTLDGKPLDFVAGMKIEGSSPSLYRQEPEELSLLFLAAKRLGDLQDSPVLLHFPTDRFDPGYELDHQVEAERARPKSPGRKNRSGVRIEHQAEPFAQFARFVKWFRSQEDYENEVRLKFPEYVHRGLESVRSALGQVLPDLQGLRYDRGLGRLVVTKGGVEIDIPQLSDGERRVAMITAEIARRLTVSSPSQPNPLDGAGLVLIDEVELHLHPAWQRAILKRWLEAFPGCRFICTTHSPVVVAATPGIVHLMEGFEIKETIAAPYGLSAPEALQDIFDVDSRPEDLTARLRDVARFLDTNEVSKARAALAEVADAIGVHDPEVIRLRTILQYLED